MTVRWKGHLGLKEGDRIKAIGAMTGASKLDAWCIEDSDGMLHEQPTDSRADASSVTPLLGRVVSCTIDGGITFVSVFPIGSKAFRFRDLAGQQPILLCPEFWSYLEDKADWEELALRPGWHPQSEALPDLDVHLGVPEASWWLQKQGHLTREFEPYRIATFLGNVITKMERAERLRTKANFLDDLRRHLIACSSCDRRNRALKETIEEAAILVEQAAITVYSALDIFAHLVNAAYDLGHTPIACGFNVILIPPASAEKDEPGAHVLSEEEPLRALLEAAFASWIVRLRDIRHFVVHTGSLGEVHTSTVQSYAAFHPDLMDLRTNQLLPVNAIIGQWVDNLRSLIADSLTLMRTRAEGICAGISEPPPAPRVGSAKVTTSSRALLLDVMRLLSAVDADEPRRIEFLYSKLDPTWRALWPIQQFRSYLDSLSKIRVPSTEPFGMSVGEDERARMSILADYKGRTVRLVVESRKIEKDRPVLVLIPLTYPIAAEASTKLVEFTSRQSGAETGCRRAIFTAKIENTSDRELADVAIHVFHSDERWAHADLGNISPAEAKSIEFSTTDEVSQILPPGGPYLLISLLHDPLHIRVTYNCPSDHGPLWADDFTSTGLRGRPA